MLHLAVKILTMHRKPLSNIILKNTEDINVKSFNLTLTSQIKSTLIKSTYD